MQLRNFMTTLNGGVSIFYDKSDFVRVEWSGERKRAIRGQEKAIYSRSCFPSWVLSYL